MEYYNHLPLWGEVRLYFSTSLHTDSLLLFRCHHLVWLLQYFTYKSYLSNTVPNSIGSHLHFSFRSRQCQTFVFQTSKNVRRQGFHWSLIEDEPLKLPPHDATTRNLCLCLRHCRQLHFFVNRLIWLYALCICWSCCLGDYHFFYFIKVDCLPCLPKIIVVLHY